MNKLFLPVIILFCILSTSCHQKSAAKSEYLLLVNDTINDRYGYVSPKGDTVIPLGNYDFCFTDTFRAYAIVHKTTGGYYAIDRDQKDLYEVFNYDNGPDYTEDGYFRIIENGKIGYADAVTGKVVIKPQYEAAFPFENGVAKVAVHATKEMASENSIWISDGWIYIDKKGMFVHKNQQLISSTSSANSFFDNKIYAVLDSAVGDLNLDDFPDKILVLKNNRDSLATDVPRPLLLLVGQQDGSYKLAARNDSVVLTADDGGVAGDPYQGITIKKGYFSIEHYGGSSWRWTRIITFKYSSKDGKWYLHKDAGVSFHLSDPEKTTDITTNKEDFDNLPFEKYSNKK